MGMSCSQNGSRYCLVSVGFVLFQKRKLAVTLVLSISVTCTAIGFCSVACYDLCPVITEDDCEAGLVLVHALKGYNCCPYCAVLE